MFRTKRLQAVLIAAVCLSVALAMPAFGGPNVTASAVSALKLAKSADKRAKSADRRAKSADRRARAAEKRAAEAATAAKVPGPVGPKGDKGETGPAGVSGVLGHSYSWGQHLEKALPASATSSQFNLLSNPNLPGDRLISTTTPGRLLAQAAVTIVSGDSNAATVETATCDLLHNGEAISRPHKVTFSPAGTNPDGPALPTETIGLTGAVDIPAKPSINVGVRCIASPGDGTLGLDSVDLAVTVYAR